MLKKTDKILCITAAVLSVLYALSFVKSCSTGKRDSIKTALVNPKYSNTISTIELVSANEYIVLSKKNTSFGDFWTISSPNSNFSIPADSKKVQKLIENLTTIRNMYKLSDSLEKNNSFGLTDNNTFCISYNFDDGMRSIFFGNQDFSQTSRYLMTDKNTTVYEIDDSMDLFLSASVQNWSDPLIVSTEIFGATDESDVQRTSVAVAGKVLKISDCQKFLQLRHGGLASSALIESASKTADTIITLELGNKTAVQISIYQTASESEFLVKTEYLNSSSSSVYTSYSKISLWTYNKIKEITL